MGSLLHGETLVMWVSDKPQNLWESLLIPVYQVCVRGSCGLKQKSVYAWAADVIGLGPLKACALNLVGSVKRFRAKMNW